MSSIALENFATWESDATLLIEAPSHISATSKRENGLLAHKRHSPNGENDQWDNSKSASSKPRCVYQNRCGLSGCVHCDQIRANRKLPEVLENIKPKAPKLYFLTLTLRQEHDASRETPLKRTTWHTLQQHHFTAEASLLGLQSTWWDSTSPCGTRAEWLERPFPSSDRIRTRKPK